MKIKVSGTGCAKCRALKKATKKTFENTGVNALIRKAEDIVEIMQFGVMTNTASVINGEIVVKGKVPSKDELSI